MDMSIIRFSLAALLIAGGVFILSVATLALFRLKYVLNRICATSKCDTLGAMMMLFGCCVLFGFSFTSLKLLLLVVFVWLTNPVAVHMIGLSEVLTNPELEDDVEIVDLTAKAEKTPEEATL